VEGIDWHDLQVLPLVDELRLTPSIVRSVFDTSKTHADKFVEILKSIPSNPPHRSERKGSDLLQVKAVQPVAGMNDAVATAPSARASRKK
jgi:hypothetical protein